MEVFMAIQTKKNSRLKIMYVGIKALALFVLIISIIGFFTPIQIIKEIYDFEKHHFFLFAFISLSVFFAFLKLYLSISQEKGVLNREVLKIKKSIQEKRRLKNQSDIGLSKTMAVDKKDIPKLRFDSKETLNSIEAVLERDRQLYRAMILGNSYKQKVKIFFKDLVSYKSVETTVWFVGDKHVSLKQGVLLPKNTIYKIII